MGTTGNITRRIFEALRAGKRESFDRFFERNAVRVLVYINYHLGPRLRRKLEPNDILQNLYLTLYRNFENFMERAREQGTRLALIRMADHEITEAYRFHFKTSKRDARREVTALYLDPESQEARSAIDWAPSRTTSVTQRLVQQEEYRRVMGMLRLLNPTEQYVLVARIIEGLSTREIAEELGKTPGAVQMMIARARDKLRAQAGSNPELPEGEE